VIEDQLLTPDDLAKYLGVPVRTIYSWRATGEGPRRIRVGKHLRFRLSDVEEYLETRSEPARAAVG
jgi:excisionase family DNA binding protein